MRNQRVLTVLSGLINTYKHLIHLLALPQPGEDNLNVAPALFYHLPSNIHDLDRITHVEDEGLTMVTDHCRLKYEMDGLGDGHEVAGDIDVGDGDGATLFDLVPEGG